MSHETWDVDWSQYWADGEWKKGRKRGLGSKEKAAKKFEGTKRPLPVTCLHKGGKSGHGFLTFLALMGFCLGRCTSTVFDFSILVFGGSGSLVAIAIHRQVHGSFVRHRHMANMLCQKSLSREIQLLVFMILTFQAISGIRLFLGCQHTSSDIPSILLVCEATAATVAREVRPDAPGFAS